MNNFSTSRHKIIKCEIPGALSSLKLYTPWCCVGALKPGHLSLDLESPGIGQTLPSWSWKCSPVSLCLSSHTHTAAHPVVCVQERRYWWPSVLEPSKRPFRNQYLLVSFKQDARRRKMLGFFNCLTSMLSLTEEACFKLYFILGPIQPWKITPLYLCSFATLMMFVAGAFWKQKRRVLCVMPN